MKEKKLISEEKVPNNIECDNRLVRIFGNRISSVGFEKQPNDVR